MAPPLVVFDLDGTLVDSARDIAASVNAALAQLAPASAPLPLERVVGFVGDGARTLIERVLAHARLELGVEAVLPVYLACYRERLLDNTRLYPGVEAALAGLAEAGRELAVLSNKPGELCRAVLDGLGTSSRFARVWGAGDTPTRKPDPGGLVALVREIRAEVHETWFIGDSPTDVQTGRAAGIRVAGALWGFDPAALRAAAPDRLLARPEELANLTK